MAYRKTNAVYVIFRTKYRYDMYLREYRKSMLRQLCGRKWIGIYFWIYIISVHSHSNLHTYKDGKGLQWEFQKLKWKHWYFKQYPNKYQKKHKGKSSVVKAILKYNFCDFTLLLHVPSIFYLPSPYPTGYLLMYREWVTTQISSLW